MLLLKNKKTGKPGFSEIDFIFNCERFFAKTFNIKKCLISSICLFHTFKQLGISCNFIIGISKNDVFTSHSWIEIKQKSFLKDPNNKFAQIYKI